MPTRYFAIFAAALIALSAGTVAYAHESTPALRDGSGAMSLSGPCTATATIVETGTPIDPKASNKLVAPLSGSATYDASISGVSGERAVGGSVRVKLPIGSVTIKSWSDDKAKATSDSGKVSWDLPSTLPHGITLRASGVHNDQGVSCSGWMDVQIEGGIMDSPAGPASLGLTVIFLFGVAFAWLPKIR